MLGFGVSQKYSKTKLQICAWSGFPKHGKASQPSALPRLPLLLGGSVSVAVKS